MVIEREGGFETPFGFVKLPLDRVLDFLCDLGFDTVYVVKSEAGSGCGDVGDKGSAGSEKNESEETEWEVEWETPRSIIEKLKKSEKSRECGAIAMFIGFVREFNEGRKVIRLEYERNEELYIKKLEELKERIRSYPGVAEVEIFHRTGKVMAGEDIVYVAVMGRGRKDVWKALEDAVEGMKKELPVWKKEVFEGGEIWI